MPPPLSDTNFVDEGSLIGIRQTEEDPKTWNSRKQQNQEFHSKYQDVSRRITLKRFYLRTRSATHPNSHLTGRSIMDQTRFYQAATQDSK